MVETICKPKRLTVKQAAEEFFQGNVSEGMIYSMVKKGEVPHVKLSSGKILLDAESLELWWQNKLTQSLQQEVKKEEKVIGYGTLRKVAE